MPAVDSTLLTAADEGSSVAEAYRTLRTNVQFAGVDRPLHSLLVASAGLEADKSTVAANLAIAFALGGRRVILVDADLRLPCQHTLFGLTNERGLTSLLLDGVNDPLPLQETGVRDLRLLASGPLPASPSDILESQKFADIVQRLQGAADLLVLDAPPVLAVTDAAVIARRMDGVLLVFRANRTKRDHAAKARALLEKVQANVLGAVLTNSKLDGGLKAYYGKGGS
ncbi:MAG: CpsD/CapB family tyrosine-protein kinase [Chloroflexota bacterium]